MRFGIIVVIEYGLLYGDAALAGTYDLNQRVGTRKRSPLGVTRRTQSYRTFPNVNFCYKAMIQLNSQNGRMITKADRQPQG